MMHRQSVRFVMMGAVMGSPVGNGVEVTVVVIAHNERARAHECIRSILDQSSKARLEVLLVDDGSTDGTAESVSDLVASDERLRILRFDQNRGRGAARAEGVAAARGAVIGFVDADITLPRDWLDRCMAALPGAAAVGGIPVPDGDSSVVARITHAAPRVVPGRMPITGSNVLFDATVLRTTGFDPRDRLGEDFRLAARLGRAGHQLRRVPGLTVRHDETKSYGRTIRWRFEIGIDAASHPRELGLLRLADAVWTGWLISWVLAIVGAFINGALWILVGIAASVGVGVVHAFTRFYWRPLLPFIRASLADIPLMNAYMLGRTWGLPRLVFGRSQPSDGPR